MTLAGMLSLTRRVGTPAVEVVGRTLRGRVELGLGRLRGGAWPVVQTALAASLTWYIASELLGEDKPFIAAIAAIISVGAVAGQTLRRAVEWIFGVTVGLSVADLIHSFIGVGVVQTGVIVGLAMATALTLRSGIMFVTESGVSAILVANLDPTTYGLSPDRFVEALVGGSIALSVALVFPSNPSLRVRKAARPILEDLAIVHRRSAEALGDGDSGLAGRTLEEARRVDALVGTLRDEVDGGYQIARYSPSRRGHLGNLDYYATALEQLDLAVRNTRVLARAVVGALEIGGEVPEQVPAAMLDLARAVESLADYLESPDHPPDTRHYALEASRKATRALKHSHDLETSVLVGQIRSTAFDLLRASSMTPEEATSAFREAVDG